MNYLYIVEIYKIRENCENSKLNFHCQEQVRIDSSKCDNSSRSSSCKDDQTSQNTKDSNPSSTFTPVEAFEGRLYKFWTGADEKQIISVN